jgi:hypothetical protein
MRLKQLLSIATLLALSSCASQIVKFEGDNKTVTQWKKVAIVELAIAPPETPVFPLLDAAMYNSSFAKIYPQLNEVHASAIDTLTDDFGSAFKAASGVEYLYGKQLVSMPEYAAIEGKSPKIPNANFPELVTIAGTKNVIEVSGNSFNDNHLNNKKPSAEGLSKIATDLKVDGVVVGLVSVPTIGAAAFGLSGSRMSKVSLYFFDAKGKFVMKGFASSLPSSSSAGDIKHYQTALENSGTLAQALADKIYGKSK